MPLPPSAGATAAIPATEASELSSLWKRSLDAAAEGITISDAALPDNPIIYVNGGFERMTGYRSEEVVGRNCRFLQGADTDSLAVTRIREAVAAGRECTVELENYRKDGQLFWNRLSIRPLRDAAGEITHFIGIQSDVTRQRTADEDLRRAQRELESAYRGLRQSLDAAAKIQRALLPAKPPRIDGLEFEWMFEPCDQLAGDSLNLIPLDDRHLAFYVLDVSGHGAPAALLSVTLGRLLTSVADESILFDAAVAGRGEPRIALPSQVLERLNKQFPFEPTTSQYFTIFYGILDLETLKLRYASAGHPPGVIVSRLGTGRHLDASGFPVGLMPEASYESRTAALEPGDRLILYTDGATEASNASGVEFGHERLTALLAATRAQSLSGSLSTVLAAVEDWCETDRLADDLSLLGIGIRGAATPGRRD